MKLVISVPKTGKAFHKEISQDEAQMFYGLTIGDVVDLSPLGMAGYKARITGGTDKDGFPMRPDVHGTGRKKILLSAGPGVRKLKKGQRVRKTVRGNVVAEDVEQLNLVIIEEGEKPIEELMGGAQEGEGSS